MKETLILELQSLRQKIHFHLEERGIRRLWLAQKTGLSKSCISHCLNGGHPITQKTLDKINEALQTDFKID